MAVPTSTRRTRSSWAVSSGPISARWHAYTEPVSRPSSSAIRQTPVSLSPARMARSTGAAPRQRGRSEKCRFTMGSRSRTWGRMRRPKATTTPSSAPASRTSSTRSLTARPSSWAAAFTGVGSRSAPRARRRSGWVTTRTISWPASTSARSGDTAASGLPKKARRARRPASRLSRRPAPAGFPGQLQSPGPQLAHGLLALLGIEALDEQLALQVVVLVLEDAGQKLVGADRQIVAVDVHAREVDLLGPHDGPVQPGDGEAALFVGPLPAVVVQHGVDDDVGPGLVVGVVHEDPALHPDLRSGQPHAGGGVHGLDHVPGQAADAFVDVGDRRGPLAENGVPEHADAVGRHRAQSVQVRLRPDGGPPPPERGPRDGPRPPARRTARRGRGPAP